MQRQPPDGRRAGPGDQGLPAERGKAGGTRPDPGGRQETQLEARRPLGRAGVPRRATWSLWKPLSSAVSAVAGAVPRSVAVCPENFTRRPRGRADVACKPRFGNAWARLEMMGREPGARGQGAGREGRLLDLVGGLLEHPRLGGTGLTGELSPRWDLVPISRAPFPSRMACSSIWRRSEKEGKGKPVSGGGVGRDAGGVHPGTGAPPPPRGTPGGPAGGREGGRPEGWGSVKWDRRRFLAPSLSSLGHREKVKDIVQPDQLSRQRPGLETGHPEDREPQQASTAEVTAGSRCLSLLDPEGSPGGGGTRP